MAESLPSLQGELQIQVMGVLWKQDEATVEQVRSGLPPRYCGAYTTVQTVLNRLADRGLLDRRRDGTRIVYRPSLSEAEFVRRSVDSTLAGASAHARQTVLAALLGDLDADEIARLRTLGRQAEREREAS